MSQTATMVMDRIADKGEDQAASGVNWAAVFDGLGGAGGRMCAVPRSGDSTPDAPQVASEAYVASRIARAAVENTMGDSRVDVEELLAACACEKDVVEVAHDLRGRLEVALDRAFLKARGDCALAALMMTRQTGRQDAAARDGDALALGEVVALPTNMALVLDAVTPVGRFAISLWAGDARCYLLDGESLRQLSVDDNEAGDDAMEDLLHEAPVPQTRRLGYDRALEGTRLSANVTRVETPALLFCSSDGCYSANGLASPMHFEALVRRHIADAGGDLRTACDTLRAFFEANGSDDCSLGLVAVCDDADPCGRAGDSEPTHGLAKDLPRDHGPHDSDTGTAVGHGETEGDSVPAASERRDLVDGDYDGNVALAAMARKPMGHLRDEYLAGYPKPPSLPAVGPAVQDLGDLLDKDPSFQANTADYLLGLVDGDPAACPVGLRALIREAREVRERERARWIEPAMFAGMPVRTAARVARLVDECVRLTCEVQAASGMRARTSAREMIAERVAEGGLGKWYAFLDQKPYMVGNPELDARAAEVVRLKTLRSELEPGHRERVQHYREERLDIWKTYKPAYEAFMRRV